MNFFSQTVCLASAILVADCLAQTPEISPVKDIPAEIRTPKPPSTPRINGPSVFGVRPGNPFLYRIPATGDRPMEFAVDGLPEGLKIQAETGQITGTLANAGEYIVTLKAKNAKGASEKKFKIVAGETIALTPPLGWNSWNCWGREVDADKVRKSAHAMVSSGLINHGWSYINIDDAWQEKRSGPFNAIQPNEKFPDMKSLSDEVHALGLKIGIYSTPWITSYARHVGGSADNEEGNWPPPKTPAYPEGGRYQIGKYSFAENDVKQWVAWGIDYLKYDWNPIQAPETEDMRNALRKSGRDIIYSLSNSTPFKKAAVLTKLANCWRTTGDIEDSWLIMARIGFRQSQWAEFSRPGGWNDPDMLVVGYVSTGKGRVMHFTHLTPDEQYTHITLWSLLTAPLLIGCDMEKLDEFTLNLLTNDEVLAVNQDPLGKQATLVSQENGEVKLDPARPLKLPTLQVWAKPLEDGSIAVGLFNLWNETATVTANWADLKISGKQKVRDVWRQKDLGEFDEKFSVAVQPHGAEMVRVIPHSKQ